MTAIITKQNAKDGAFIGGSGGSIDVDDAEFVNLHVKNNVTVDNDVIVNGTSIANHESRITALEESNSTIVDGLDDFAITASTLTITETALSIAFTAPSNYDGDLFEVVWFDNSAVLSFHEGKYHNVKITNGELTNGENTYEVSEVIDDDCPKIYMSKSMMELYTTGFMRINYIAPQKTSVIDCAIKCTTIDADNCFKLMRSPLPDFYEMRNYGEKHDYYYCDYGYVPGTAEFDELLDGQVFEFFDEVFGTTYKMVKKDGEWQGTNYSWHIPGNVVVNGETSFSKHKTQPLMIQINDVNTSIIDVLLKDYSHRNPFEVMNEQGLITFNDCTIDRFSNDTTYYYMYVKCTIKKSCNFTVTVNINNTPYTTEFGFEYSSYEPESCYKVNSPNCYNLIPYHHCGKVEIDNPPYGLILYMPKDPQFIHTITDVDYEPNTNTFSFLASNGMYTVTPRPEACTTLYTNYNIQTSGVVIGENIESHVFVLNSLGNTVDVAVNNISQLQNYCQELQQEIHNMNNKTTWFDVLAEVVKIGATVIFGGGGGCIMKIAENGLSNLMGLSFAADEEIGAAVINACDRASMVLGPEIVSEELVMLSNDELLDGTICYRYRCLKLDPSYDIIVGVAIDGTGEVIRTDHYTTTDDAINYEFPILKIISVNKIVSVTINHIPHSRSELGLGETLRDDHILSSAATVKLIENHKKNIMSTMNEYYTKEQVDEKFIDENELKTYILNTNLKTEQVKIRTTENSSYIDDFGEEISEKLQKAIINIEGKLINDDNTYTDITGSYEFVSFDQETIKHKNNDDDVISIYYRYYDGEISFNDNYNVLIESFTISLPSTTFNDNEIPSMNFAIGNFAMKDDVDKKVDKSMIVSKIEGEVMDFTSTTKIPSCYIVRKYSDSKYFMKQYVYTTAHATNDSYYISDTHVPSTAMMMKRINETLKTYIPNDLVTETTLKDYALKTDVPSVLRKIDFTYEKLSNGMLYYVFTLANPINNFTAHVVFKWINKEGQQQTTLYEDSIRDGAIVFRKGESVVYTFEGKTVSITGKNDNTEYNESENKYEVVLPLNYKVYGELISIEETETYFAETLLFSNELNDYARKSNVIGNTGDQTISGTLRVANYIKLTSINATGRIYNPSFSNSTLDFGDNIFSFGCGGFINGDLVASGTIISNGSNTITHYCPIEAGENIDDFIIGKPVFLSGHVYKKESDQWHSSTATDTIDCICSVVSKGTWKEFVGVITEVNNNDKCIKFASHGDYLFNVDDSNIYAIGDVLLYDGRILDEDYAMTLRIQQSIVGKVSAKINEHMISLFKA